VTASAARAAAGRRAARALWLIPAALALHNLEEALTFPRYLPLVRERLPEVARPLAARLDVAGLRAALVLVTLLALLVVAWAIRRPDSRLPLWCALSVQAVVALNVVSHVVVSLTVMRGYTPGLATALAVNAPLSVYLLRRALAEAWISRASWWLLLPSALLFHGPGLIGLLLLV
jgi:hypothetical protein